MNDRWERLIDLYHSAVMLPADERATLLAEECGDDPALQADVERMITAHHKVSRPTLITSVVNAAPTMAPPQAPVSVPPLKPERQTPPEPRIEPATSDESIVAFADERKLSITERLELFLLVCAAVKSAQKRGVPYGELDATSITVTPAGTPRLPEFGLGEDHATPASDIASLGLVLDRLLGTGVANAGSRRPLRRELDTIVLKAIREDGEFKYASLDLLVEDIQKYLDNPPARERRDATRPARPAKARTRLSATVAWVIAGAAVVALGVMTVPLLQRERAEPAVVVRGSDVNAAQTRLAVADFEDRAGDPSLATALSEALRAGLTESPTVAVTGPRGQTDATLNGSVARAGAGFTISVTLTKGRNSKSTTLTQSAVDSNSALNALRQLSEQIREHFGESATSISELPRLDQVTTSSLPALRAYSTASHAIRAGDRLGGVRGLRAAIAADSSYASAYRLLGLTYRDLGEQARSADAMDHATANQARLPFFDRNYAIASQSMNGGNYASAIDAYNRILSRDPRDTRVINSLALAHAARHEYAVQESLLVRAISLDGDMPWLHTGVAMAAINQGKYADARRALDKTELRFGVLRSTQLGRVALAASEQDWDTAERDARELTVRMQSDSVDALEGLATLGSILMTQGHLSEAEQQLRRVIAAGMRQGAVKQTYAASLKLAYMELRYRHAPAAAIKEITATLARFPLAKMDADDRPYDELARLFADAGQAGRAADLMADAARARGARSADANRRWTGGAIAMAERRAWEGEIEIQGAAESHPCPICALPDLARAYEVAGKSDRAIETYERYINSPWQRRFDTDAIELGFARKRLGELYQQQNERTKAVAQYSALLQLWRSADAELEPTIADVRRRLEQVDRGGRTP